MVINEKDLDWFKKTFDLLDDNDTDSDQFKEYEPSTESSEPFEDLAKEVREEIGKNKDKGAAIVKKENPHSIIKDVCVDNVFDVIDEDSCKEQEFQQSTIEEDDIFDDLPTQKMLEDKEDDLFDGFTEQKEIIKEDKKEQKKETPSLVVEEGSCPDNYNTEIGSGDGKIEWKLDSPSTMYNSFYTKKRDLLFKYMVGGQAEYRRWTTELEEANVIIKGEIFDHQLIIRQMEAVQQHRERVKFIQIRVNNQYFTFKRFIEMLKGFLARIEYLKPIIRQEGLIMEHMGDVELYYARLEALHDSAAKTEKMLAAAFDTLSRKCTICMELKPPERIEKKISNVPSYVPESSLSVRESSNEFDEFDDLPLNAHAVPRDYKIGAISWGDI